MNPLAILAGMLACLTAARAGEPSSPPHWGHMQQAVLFEQDLEKIKKLVAEGLDPSAPIGCGTYAPLDGAIQVANPAMLQLLISLGAKPAPRHLVRAAFVANHQAAVELVSALLKAGVPINAREYDLSRKTEFSTALHHAVWRQNTELVALLLKQPGIELETFNVDSRTPLMIAAEKGHEELVDMLLAAGADPHVKNKEGLTASAYADQVIARQNAIKLKLSPATASQTP